MKLKYQSRSRGPPVQICLCERNRYIMSSMCVELTCCVINSDYSLKATLECVLWPGFLRKIDCTVFHELQLPLCCFNPLEILWGHSWIFSLQKNVWFSSILNLLPFYEAFSNPIKIEKFSKGHKSKFYKQ